MNLDKSKVMILGGDEGWAYGGEGTGGNFEF